MSFFQNNIYYIHLCLFKMGTLSADLDEMSSEASMSEEKAQRAMIDAARYIFPNGYPFLISSIIEWL